MSNSKNFVCCGAHEVCETEQLLRLSDEIIYYSDEELDEYRGREADDYSEEEIEEFREVLLTMRTYEVAGWLKSLELRRVEPPSIVREEAMMIISENEQKE